MYLPQLHVLCTLLAGIDLGEEVNELPHVSLLIL